MLPKENRHLTDFDYRRLRREGRRFGSSSLALFVLINQPGPARVGLVVSSQVSKSAAKRNRIKRVLREEVRQLLPQLRPGVLAAFWVRPAALTISPADLRREAREVLMRAGVYR